LNQAKQPIGRKERKTNNETKRNITNVAAKSIGAEKKLKRALMHSQT